METFASKIRQDIMIEGQKTDREEFKLKSYAGDVLTILNPHKMLEQIEKIEYLCVCVK